MVYGKMQACLTCYPIDSDSTGHISTGMDRTEWAGYLLNFWNSRKWLSALFSDRSALLLSRVHHFLYLRLSLLQASHAWGDSFNQKKVRIKSANNPIHNRYVYYPGAILSGCFPSISQLQILNSTAENSYLCHCFQPHKDHRIWLFDRTSRPLQKNRKQDQKTSQELFFPIKRS